MYEIAMKNKNKPEFDWSNNESCIDFHLLVDENPNYYYSGSFCDNSFDYYDELHDGERMLEYDIDEFKLRAEQTVKKFLNRKNKKQYHIDEFIEKIQVKLWNDLTDTVDELYLVLFLTYCP